MIAHLVLVGVGKGVDVWNLFYSSNQNSHYRDMAFNGITWAVSTTDSMLGQESFAVPCCAVLCCAVLCCGKSRSLSPAVLCCAVLCCVAPCCPFCFER